MNQVGRDMSRGAVLRLGALLGISAVVLIAARSSIPEANGLFDESLPPDPHFVSGHFFLLCVQVPAVALAAIALLLAPGCCLALASRPSAGFAEVVVKGFALSAGLHTVASAVARWGAGTVTPEVFLGWLVLAAGLGWLRLYVSTGGIGGQERTLTSARFAVSASLCLLTLWLLLPVLFWQDLTGDGAEQLYAAQSLDTFVLPRFPTPSGVCSLGEGMLFQPIVTSWFVHLFGANEASLRLPLVLYLPVLFCALLIVIEHGGPRALATRELLCVALGVAVFVVALVFNATYNPYSTDTASPGGMEYATVIAMIGTIYFLWTREWRWFFAFVLIGLLSRPTQIIVLSALGVGAFIVLRPRLRAITPLAAAIGFGIALSVLLDLTYASAGGGQNLLRRFAYIRIDDLSRLAMVVAGGGLLPVVGLLAYRRQDDGTRVLTIAWLLMVAVFYLPAFFALHFLAPMMILPIVVFWRFVLRNESRAWVPAAALAGICALILAIPFDWHLVRYQRTVGRSVRLEVGDLHGDFEARRRAVRAAPALNHLFPALPGRGDKEFVGNWLAIVYYAKGPGTGGPAASYVLRSIDDPLPDHEPEASTDLAAVYVLDRKVWDAHRYGEFDTHFRARLYEIPAETLFPFVGVPRRNYTFSMKRVPLLRRFF